MPKTTLAQVEALKSVWHKPDMDRNEATAYLATKPVGSFVIRRSTQAKCYALTVMVQGGKVWNGLVEEMPVSLTRDLRVWCQEETGGTQSWVVCSFHHPSHPSFPLQSSFLQNGLCVNKSSLRFATLAALIFAMTSAATSAACGIPAPLICPEEDTEV